MTEPTLDTTTPQEAPRKASKARVIMMLIAGGFVLAVGGCALFLTNLNLGSSTSGARDGLSAAGAIGFIAGVIGFVVGILWALARAIDRRFDQSKKA